MTTVANWVQAKRLWVKEASNLERMLRWPNHVFPEAMADVASSREDATALIYNGYGTTYEELLDEARRLARGLADIGHAHGEPLAIWLPNRPAWIVSYLAGTMLGAPVIGVNTRYREGELGHLIGDSGATTLILQPTFLDRDYLSTLGNVVPSGDADGDDDSDLERFVVVDADGADLPTNATAFDAVTARGRDAPALDRAVEPSDPCTVFYTSGTTSRAKGVVHDHVSSANHPRAIAEWFGVTDDDTGLALLPICGSGGWDYAWSVLLAGGRLVLHSRFDAAAAATAIEEHGVTYLIALGEMYEGMLSTKRDLTSLERGSAFFRTGEALMRRIEERCGFPVIEPYGLSEAHSHICMSRPDAPFDDRIGKGGPPIDEGIEVSVHDPDTGEPLEAGSHGELCVRGYSRMDRYLHDDSGEASDLTAEGWLRTGDLGTVDQDGRLWYESRLDDALRLRGFLVAPSEIEATLESRPDVAEAHVVGVATDDGEEVPVAFVRATPDAATPSTDSITEFLYSQLADYKVPVRIEFVDEFPVTESANGPKVRKTELSDRAANLLS